MSGWDVSWYDEFNGNSVDTSLWNVIFSTNPTNESLHAYLPDQVSVSGGNLVITTNDTPFGNLPYRSGQVISTQNQQYGKWEVRADLPTSRGQWPAIWLLPNVGQHPWPSQGEIDIMENRGNEPNTTSSAFHYGTNPPFNHSFVFEEQGSFVDGNRANYHTGFHTYGVEWSADVLRFFVDGVNYYNVHDADVGGFLGNQTAGMETVINNAVGGWFLDNPNASSVWPQEMLIDYVHVYSPSASPAAMEFENGNFEGSDNPHHSPLAGWTTFGAAQFGNVSAHNEAVLEGDHSLKLFGNFNDPGHSYSGVERGMSVSAGEELRAMASNFIRSADSIAGTDNSVILKIDYFSRRHAEFGSADYISSDQIMIADGSTANDAWLLNELRSTAPNGAVEARLALVFSQPSQQGGAVHVDDVIFGRRGDNVLLWDGLGNGFWDDARWEGSGPEVPSDFDHAIIRNNRVAVIGSQQAHVTTVGSGELHVVNQLASEVTVASNGSVVNSGVILGNVSIDGNLLIESTGALSVGGSIELGADADLLIATTYSQTRGTYTGDTVVLQGAFVTGQFTAVAGEHLGEGIFLDSITYNPNQVLVDIYSALPGDANGDGLVDGADFLIWNANKFNTGTDWLTADFNGDGLTDGADFLIWNMNKFTSASRIESVPEPILGTFVGLIGLLIMTRRRSAL